MPALKKSSEYCLGEPVRVIESKYWHDGIKGDFYVSGHLPPNDLKLSRYLEDALKGKWIYIVHLCRIEGSGHQR